MGKVVLIMASGGENGVWKHPIYPNNLLLPIGDELLVPRAVRQVAEITGRDPIVLTHWPEVQKVVPVYFVPEKHYGYAETFLSAFQVWEMADRVTVLNGDMVWHPGILEFILVHTGSPVLYGDQVGNVFAWAFNKEHTVKVVGSAWLRAASPSQVHFFRTLWGESTLKNSPNFIFVEPAGTYTRDFDLAKDYDYQRWADL